MNFFLNILRPNVPYSFCVLMKKCRMEERAVFFPFGSFSDPPGVGVPLLLYADYLV